MSSTVEQIKERLSIVDVVSTYIKLLPAGKNFKANCPFHREKTPSFFVSPERDSYYCFGCSAKGDVFTFVEAFEGVDFKGALKLLAERAGVEITYASKGETSEKERLLKAHEAAVIFFEEQLEKDTAAQTYLKTDRGVEPAISRVFRLGYAPRGWETLSSTLKERGFNENELVRGGLAKKSDKGRGVYDTFRERIMFPITDPSGRVIAFSGRVFPPLKDGEEPTGDRGAKYLNSPDTPLFHKSQVLYGYAQAKGSMRKHDFCVVVEGQFDVVMSYQAGFTNTVAPLGTALTSQHLERIKRFTNNIVLALDADDAGVSSAGKSAALALALGCDVKVAKLPSGQDPADVVKENPDNWRTAIREAVHIVEFLLSVVIEQTSDARKRELEVRRVVLPFVARIDNKIDQAHFVKLIAEKLQLPEGALHEEVRKIAQKHDDTSPDERDVRHGRKDGTHRRDRVLEQICAIIAWQRETDAPIVDVSAVEKKVLTLTGAATLDELLPREHVKDLVFQAEVMFDGNDTIQAALDELLLAFEEERLREELIGVMGALKQAEASENTEKAAELLKQFQKVSQQVESIKTQLHMSHAQ